MKERDLSILCLTKYDPMGASSRYRFLQYFPRLEAEGIRCVASPLFDDAYLARRYGEGDGAITDFLRALWRRLAVLAQVRRYDLVFIEKELIPYFPAWLERLLLLTGVHYVADYDDALFHQYDQSRSGVVRALLGGKIAAVMRHSRLVIAGNGYLASYARNCGASKVEVLPTVIDLERYPRSEPAENDRFTIGWIGSPSTSVYMTHIAPVLADICRGGRARVVMIGAGSVDLPGVPVEMVSWSGETEVAEMSRFDVGIMPLPDSPWTRGKCGFKLIQYMACRLPVIASPVGVNCEIVDPGVNGFLAQGHEEWLRALTVLRDDVELRRRLGEAGRAKVEERYSLQAVAPRLASLIRGAVREGER